MGKFFKDTTITFISRIFVILIQMGIYIIIARVFGPYGKGVYSLTFLLPTLIVVFTNLGIGSATVYHIGRKKYSLSSILKTNLFISFPLGIIGILAGVLIVLFSKNTLFKGVPPIYLFGALFMIPFALGFRYLHAILLGLQRITIYNLLYTFRFFLFFLLLCINIILFRSLPGVIFLNIFSLFTTFCILFFMLNKDFSISLSPINIEYAKDTTLFGVKTFLSNVLAFLNYRLDMFLINFFLNPAEVGFYSVAVNIAERLWLVSQAAGTVLYPRVSSEDDEERKRRLTPLVTRTVFLISVIGGVVMFLLSKGLIVLLYSSMYLKSVFPFQLLLVGIALSAPSIILSNDITARGKPMFNTYITVITVTVNLILNLIFIPRMGISGAALASTISYLLQFTGKIIIYIRLSHNSLKDILILKKEDLRLYKEIIKF